MSVVSLIARSVGYINGTKSEKFGLFMEKLIDCWLLNAQWQIFHACSGRFYEKNIINISESENK